MSDDFQKKYEDLLNTARKLGAGYAFGKTVIDFRTLPFVNLSYSSSGEDLWLRQFMKAKMRSGTPGFYVDLGANHPVTTSNTFVFYCRGWRGICIDANPKFRDLFQGFRPRDTFVHAAVTDTGQSLYFSESKIIDKMARVAARAEDFGDSFHPPIVVPARTLADILSEHVPPGTVIDFMSVDLESSELPALRSNDWSAYMPRVILIEVERGFDPLMPLAFDTIAYLKDRGYRYEGYCVNNALMTGPNFGA